MLSTQFLQSTDTKYYHKTFVISFEIPSSPPKHTYTHSLNHLIFSARLTNPNRHHLSTLHMPSKKQSWPHLILQPTLLLPPQHITWHHPTVSFYSNHLWKTTPTKHYLTTAATFLPLLSSLTIRPTIVQRRINKNNNNKKENHQPWCQLFYSAPSSPPLGFHPPPLPLFMKTTKVL